MRLEGGGDSEDFAIRLLEEKRVLIRPGFLFDFEEDRELVLSLVTAPDIFRPGILMMK